MNCSRCRLPFTAAFPECSPGAGYHEAILCISGLRDTLIEARKPNEAAAVAERNATMGKLQVKVGDLRAALAGTQPAISDFGNTMWAEGFEHGKAKGNARIAELEAELAKLRETLEIYAAPENWMIDVIDYDLAEFVAWCPAGYGMHGNDPWTIAELRLRPPAPEMKP